MGIIFAKQHLNLKLLLRSKNYINILSLRTGERIIYLTLFCVEIGTRLKPPIWIGASQKSCKRDILNAYFDDHLNNEVSYEKGPLL